VAWAALDDGLMLKARPGVFCAGEMLDWEAPTGGDLLTACCATGRWAGQGVLRWLADPSRTSKGIGCGAHRAL
jgi:predicted flavoprotein YhiN